MVMTIARALRGKTWAANRVFEQPVNPLQFVLSGDPQEGRPAIAVYVEHATGQPRQKELQFGLQSLCSKIVLYAPPKMGFVEQGEAIAFNNDSAGLVLNLLQRQVLSHLQLGSGGWTQLFQKLTAKCTERKSRYLLIEFEDGVRLPSAEISLDWECAPEPHIGAPITGLWQALDQLLRAEGEGALADLMKASIESNENLPDWALLQAQLGMSDAAYLASGLAPLAVTDNGEVPDLEEVQIDTNIEITTPQVP
jgi:hypothetical protein